MTHTAQNTSSLTADAVVSLFDHAILHPALSDAEMRAQIEALRPYPIASVCIKPHAVSMAVEMLSDTPIEVGTVIGFPHGSQTTAAKVVETEEAFRDGAADVDMVINVGKAFSLDWDFVRQDIAAVLEVTRGAKGILKVIFETDYFPRDDLKIRLCEICGELGVDFVKTSTGFGFVKDAEGHFGYVGATVHDIRLMRKHSPPSVGIKPSGGVRTLDDVLKFMELGATRMGTTATAAIHKQALERFGC